MNAEKVNCKYCPGIHFTFKYEGEKVLRRHDTLNSHKKNIEARNANQLMSTFVIQSKADPILKIARADVLQVYHGIKSHHSYASIDCGIKINKTSYEDSAIAQKQSCGRTKATAISVNVLGPKSLEMITKELNPPAKEPLYFSLACDASNKGNRKMFPLVIQYFNTDFGVKRGLIDFYEDASESADDVTKRIKDAIKNNGLSLKYLSGYGADNTNVNFGKFHSIYTNLKKEVTSLIKANCNDHILHNAARFGTKLLTYDVETLVMKIFAEFSLSSKRIEALKTCFQFLDIEYAQILRHVMTRWLSLLHAINRIIESWPAIKMYFQKVGEKECHKAIWVFMENSYDETVLTLQECYIYFLQHYMTLMNEVNLKLQSEYLMISELHQIMVYVIDQLEGRLKDNYFGMAVHKSLRFLREEEKTLFMNDARMVYRRTIEYIKNRYDVNNSIYKNFQILNLKSTENFFTKMMKAAATVDIAVSDNFYTECKAIETAAANVASDVQVDKKWVQLLKGGLFPEVETVVAKILSLPISNAFVERVFSKMNILWSDKRNKLSIDTIKAELMTDINFNMSCQEFAIFLKSKEGKNIIVNATKQNKYTK